MMFRDFKFRDWWKVAFAICLLLNLAVAGTLRIQNLASLEGRHLLGYDSYRYLRQAELIVENGNLPERDPIRYVPLGRDLRQQPNFNAYAIAYLYKFLHFFSPSITLPQVAIYYPILCFLLSLVVFFLLVQRLLNREVALLAVTILAVASPMLQRTMAGFADRDALSLLLAFCGFYLYAGVWRTESLRMKLIYATLSGGAMGLLGLTWEGSGLLIVLIPLFGLVRLLADNYTKDDLYVDACWFATILIPLWALTHTYRNLSTPFAFLALGIPMVFLFIAAVSVLLNTKETIAAKISLNRRLPLGFVVTVLTAMVGVPLLLAFGGYGAFSSLISGLYHHFLYPVGDNRLMRTVSELQGPFLTHWWSWGGLLLLPLLAGVLLSTRKLSISLGLNPWVSTAAISVLLFGTLLSRFSPDSVLNGETIVSNALYFGSILLFTVVMLGNWLYRSWQVTGETQKKTRSFDQSHLLLLTWFLLTLFSARGGLRFSFFLIPPAVVLGSYAILQFCKRIASTERSHNLVVYLVLSVICWELFTFQDNLLAFVGRLVSFSALDLSLPWRIDLNITLALVILLMALGARHLLRSPIPRRHLRASAWLGVILFIAAMTGGLPEVDGHAKKSYASAKRTEASQLASWQPTLDWMKQNSPENSVIAAWWDYGHWIETIAAQRTIVDNDHYVPYWIHLMARHVFPLMVQLYLLEKESDYFRLVYPQEESAEVASSGGNGEKSSEAASASCCGNASPVADASKPASASCCGGGSEGEKASKPVSAGCCGSDNPGGNTANSATGGSGSSSPVKRSSGTVKKSSSTVKIWEIHYPENIQGNPEYLATEFPNPRLYQPWRGTQRK